MNASRTTTIIPRDVPRPASGGRKSPEEPRHAEESPRGGELTRGTFVPRSPGAARLDRTVAVKAAVEFPLALGLLVLASPLIAVALVAVKLTSRGPALYTQTRVGRGGVPFTIYKVRTMAHDCESLTGPRWSMPGDPRVTPLGQWLRRLHLDELPQLVNVLRGDMALVGPRPERPEIVAQLVRAVPSYAARHAVKPGITGFAQVHLPADTTVQSVRNKVAYDRHYLRAMGPLLDLAIYACTLLKLVGAKSLYARAPRRPAGGE